MVANHSMKTTTCIMIFNSDRSHITVFVVFLSCFLKPLQIRFSLLWLHMFLFQNQLASFYHEARAQGRQWYIWTRTSRHEIPRISTTSCGGGLVMSDSSMIPWTVVRQAPLSMGFSRQEYGSGLPFPSPGDLPDPGIEPTSPALAGGSFTTEPPGKPTLPVRMR